MIRLAIDTAVAACSVALFDGDRLLASRDETLGRGHAERLLPLVQEAMAEAGVTRVDEIFVDVGPGSFTGIRVGVAAARAFGLAWGAPVSGYTSTALVAASAGDGPLMVALEAGRGELYCQLFEDGAAVSEVEALAPADALARAAGRPVAGSGAPSLVGVRVVGNSYPRTRDILRLAPAQRSLPPSPLYVRAPDAKLPAA